MIDNHEYFSYKLFDQYFNNEEILLQEERGRLPNIEQIVAEIDNFIESEIVRQHCFQLQNLIYRTSINSFFNEIEFRYINVIIVNDEYFEDKSNGCTIKGATVLGKDKIERFGMGLFVQCPISRLSYHIRSLVAHELLHIYELYKKGLKGVAFKLPHNEKFYEHLKVIMLKKIEPYYTFAYLFYLNVPQEIRAVSQQIQIDAENLFFMKIYGNLPNDMTFKFYKENIMAFKDIKNLKQHLSMVFADYNNDEILEAFSYVLNKKYTDIKAVKDLINIALANIEQSYEKALSRGVEKTLLLEKNMLSPQFHIESDEQRLKNLELIDYYKNLED